MKIPYSAIAAVQKCTAPEAIVYQHAVERFTRIYNSAMGKTLEIFPP